MDFELHWIDSAIIVAYLLVTIVAGVMLTRRASQSADSYFLGGRSVPWYLLATANASGMFDIAGTMLMVTWVFVYGVKGALLPWMWPVFNQVFLMVYLSLWLRRSNVMTGAEWIGTRFGSGVGARLSNLIVVVFALISTVSFLAYAFKGIGKFAEVFLPFDLTPDQYGLVIMGVTSIYVVAGGMFGVLVTNLLQFALLTITSVQIAWIAMSRTTAEQIAERVPAGWESMAFDWSSLRIDWSETFPAVTEKIDGDGFSLFGLVFSIMLAKGVLISMAGPAPNYDMQRVLSCRTPREAALMSWFVSVVLFFPRYLMIAGVCALGLVYFGDEMRSAGEVDFEQVLPEVIADFVPVGLVGLVLAGLLAAFMGTFSGTVNCGASYIVNDLYKKYLQPEGSSRGDLVVSYAASIAIVAVGIGFGLASQSIHGVTQWIVGGLFGGYTAPNLLKWHWWRLNGEGYFCGMLGGIGAALGLATYYEGQPLLLAVEKNMALFPIILGVSALATVLGSLLTAPTDEKTLDAFYRNVRPWGWWGPVRERVIAADPGFVAGTHPARDLANCAVGTVWQLALTVLPLFIVFRAWTPCAVWVGVLAATSLVLWFTWYRPLVRETAAEETTEPLAA